jgi:hypothetical protein
LTGQLRFDPLKLRLGDLHLPTISQKSQLVLTRPGMGIKIVSFFGFKATARKARFATSTAAVFIA